MRNFDFFEFTSVLIPGTVLLFGISRFFPDAWGPAFSREFNASEFGLFVILSYIAGQLVQSIAQEIEEWYWKRKGGWPSDSVLNKTGQKLLDPEQLNLLVTRVWDLLELKFPESNTEKSRIEWFKVTRQIYAAVRHGGLNERVDLFNAHYNMFRGMVVSFAIVLLVSGLAWLRLLFKGGELHWVVMLVIAVAIGCSYAGFLRYGERYARELFVQFLEIKPGEVKGPGKTATGGKEA